MKLYSIYDKVAKRFNAPFVAENDDVANRSFQLGVKDNPYAGDLDLYCVGEFFVDVDTSKAPVKGIFASFVSHYIGEVVENG